MVPGILTPSLQAELAQLHFQAARFGLASLLFRRILVDSPQDSAALESLGLILAREGRTVAALEALSSAVAIGPVTPALLYNLAATHCAASDWPAATETLNRCLQLDSAFPPALTLIPWPLLESGSITEALTAAEAALPLAPDSSLLHRTRGRIFARLDQPEQAAAAFAESLRIDPNHPQTLAAAASYYSSISEDSLAFELFQRLVEICPAQLSAWRQLAASALSIGDINAVLAAQHQAIALGLTDPGFLSAHLRTLIQDPNTSPEALESAHLRFFPAHAKNRFFANTPDPHRPLRIGVLSGEFQGGTAAHFLAPILAISNLVRYDTRKMTDLSDEQIHQIIVQDQIDVLLDVSGLLPHNRFSVYAARAAPVQLAYPRYPASTGIRAIDYFITDPWAGASGRGPQLVLPNGYLTYVPPSEAPPNPPLPASRNGHITFGYFVGPMRLNAQVVASIAAILRRVPRSRLLIHYLVPDFDRPGRLARRRIEDEFQLNGVEPSRLRFVGERDFHGHLALLTEVEIALDSFPYSGQTNTCECLWMGVPVVTLAGDRFASRVSAAILHRTGLSDWIAATKEQYEEIAVNKAAGLPALAALRASLRQQVSASSLCNVPAVTAELQLAIRHAWGAWCQSRQSILE